MPKYVEQSDIGKGRDPEPVGSEGHESIGFDCLRCGAHLKPKPKFRRLHDAWHAELDER